MKETKENSNKWRDIFKEQSSEYQFFPNFSIDVL